MVEKYSVQPRNVATVIDTRNGLVVPGNNNFVVISPFFLNLWKKISGELGENILKKNIIDFFFRGFLRKKTPTLFGVLKKIYGICRRVAGSYKLRKRLKQRPWKITLGASGSYDKGWIPTDIYELNITKETDWERFFDSNSIDAMIAEHVWEHLLPEDAVSAAKNCYKYLKAGKCLRVAVPDGFHPDPEYIRNVKVNGEGPGAEGHRVLYTYKSLKSLFESVGFTVCLLEYYDEIGHFHSEEWDSEGGMIYRSAGRSKGETILLNASLIIDAFKIIKEDRANLRNK